jgi:hypothetical protein
VQFGISGNTTVTQYWENRNIQDDPVKTSNVAKTMSYATAGPNTRTTQLFINLVSFVFFFFFFVVVVVRFKTNAENLG